MADGEWRIRQWNPSATKATTHIIPVWWDTETNALVPDVGQDDYGLRLLWPDGKIEVYPWCSIIKAEYTPPTPDDPAWPTPGDVIG